MWNLQEQTLEIECSSYGFKDIIAKERLQHKQRESYDYWDNHMPETAQYPYIGALFSCEDYLAQLHICYGLRNVIIVKTEFCQNAQKELWNYCQKMYHRFHMNDSACGNRLLVRLKCKNLQDQIPLKKERNEIMTFSLSSCVIPCKLSNVKYVIRFPNKIQEQSLSVCLMRVNQPKIVAKRCSRISALKRSRVNRWHIQTGQQSIRVLDMVA